MLFTFDVPWLPAILNISMFFWVNSRVFLYVPQKCMKYSELGEKMSQKVLIY